MQAVPLSCIIALSYPVEMDEQETIVAIATPPGRGGIGIIRLSGPEATKIVAPLVRLRSPLAAGRARFAEIIDRATGEILDEAVLTFFAGPQSYTGEDVIEIAAHGAPVLLEYLLRECSVAGARLAFPGEFTERAFLSGRLDLTQAEAVGDLIDASTLEQARVAARQLGGGLSREIGPIKARLVSLIAEMEAGIDFAEDDISVMAIEKIVSAINDLIEPLETLAASFTYGRILREGFTLALVGRPNAGKSSLFNRLLERDRSIVTPNPGTTRDTIMERLAIGGIPVELIDTAGLRPSLEGVDEAEQLGIARSRRMMAEATIVVLVLDAGKPLHDEDAKVISALTGRPFLVALNKIDLLTEPSGLMPEWDNLPAVKTSAMTGEGVAALRAAILNLLGSGDSPSTMVTNLRQQQSIENSLLELRAGRHASLNKIPHEMVLLNLYTALLRLDELTGSTATDDVLRLIFSKFCIGK